MPSPPTVAATVVHASNKYVQGEFIEIKQVLLTPASYSGHFIPTSVMALL